MSRSQNQTWKSLTVLAAMSLAAQLPAPAGFAAPTPSIQAQVIEGKSELAKGRIDNAIQILSKAAKTLGETPGSCDCHFNLGKAYCQKAKAQKTDADKAKTSYLSAKKELRTAVRVGKGNIVAKQANEYLLTNLPTELVSPKAGEGTEMIAARLGLRGADRGINGIPKGTVFEFYADWCEPCKQLKPVLAKIKEQYGDQVEVQSINVDDKANAEIVDQYDVSPIPTVIFMNPDGQVTGYSIGYAGEKNVQKELQKILPNKT